MNKRREIKKIVDGINVKEGAGVHLKRVIGTGDPYEFDPFLLLDDFRSDKPEDYIKGFPWHPHRGIETITYILKGDVEHKDSSGNSGVIGKGDIQWMTAGSGVYHQEMPKGDEDGKMYGFQLWANLPSDYKMMDPRYQGITASEIPLVKDENGVEIKVIAGTYMETTGPVKDIVISPEYYDVMIPEGQSFKIDIEKGKTTFAYVFGGGGEIGNGKTLRNGHLVLFDDGDFIEVKTDKTFIHFLLISGKPIKEKIAWQGPVVMNTKEELETAYDDLKKGRFVK